MKKALTIVAMGALVVSCSAQAASWKDRSLNLGRLLLAKGIYNGIATTDGYNQAANNFRTVLAAPLKKHQYTDALAELNQAANLLDQTMIRIKNIDKTASALSWDDAWSLRITFQRNAVATCSSAYETFLGLANTKYKFLTNNGTIQDPADNLDPFQVKQAVEQVLSTYTSSGLPTLADGTCTGQ